MRRCVHFDESGIWFNNDDALTPFDSSRPELEFDFERRYECLKFFDTTRMKFG